jgi:hypothetical protein
MNKTLTCHDLVARDPLQLGFAADLDRPTPGRVLLPTTPEAKVQYHVDTATEEPWPQVIQDGRESLAPLRFQVICRRPVRIQPQIPLVLRQEDTSNAFGARPGISERSRWFEF